MLSGRCSQDLSSTVITSVYDFENGFLGEFSDCHELLFEIFRIHGHFELRNVRRGLRFEVFDPQFVYAGLKYDGIDIVYELTFVIRIHHQNREFRSVGSLHMRAYVGFWTEAGTL